MELELLVENSYKILSSEMVQMKNCMFLCKKRNFRLCWEMHLDSVLLSKVLNLELGYEITILDQVFDGLVQFYRQQDTARPLMGDFQLGIELLYRLQAYNNMFNIKATNPAPSIQVSMFNVVTNV